MQIKKNCYKYPYKNKIYSYHKVKGGVIVNQSPNTYLFTGTTLATDIIFETTPQVSVASTSTLPAGITFADNKLSIPANFNFGQAYSMTFMVGTDVGKYEVTINTVVI